MACSSRSSCYGTRIEEDGPFFRVGGHQDLLMCPGVVRVDPAGLVSAVDIQNCQGAGAFGTERADQQDYSAVEKIVDKVRVLVPKGLFTHAFVWIPTRTWAQEESDSLFHGGISPQRHEDHKGDRARRKAVGRRQKTRSEARLSRSPVRRGFGSPLRFLMFLRRG